jgi:hypothetical protein
MIVTQNNGGGIGTDSPQKDFPRMHKRGIENASGYYYRAFGPVLAIERNEPENFLLLDSGKGLHKLEHVLRIADCHSGWVISLND